VNDLATIMRKMMEIMDATEKSQSRGIMHVVWAINDDELESKIT